ncbi:MAG: hypothetical protein QOI76_1772, partial [Frankiales bacterium]|nr:hypothetical protein [Frankiales bacterium]
MVRTLAQYGSGASADQKTPYVGDRLAGIGEEANRGRIVPTWARGNPPLLQTGDDARRNEGNSFHVVGHHELDEALVLIGSNPSISYHRTHSPEARAAYAQILTLGGSLATWTWTDPRPGLVSRSATTPSHGRAVFA